MAQESKNEDRKQRICEAFHDGKQVARMPVREDMAPQHSDDVIYRVAPYCRVSTMSEMQAESFEIQQQYYNEFIAKHPNWTLVRIYADEGISRFIGHSGAIPLPANHTLPSPELLIPSRTLISSAL